MTTLTTCRGSVNCTRCKECDLDSKLCKKAERRAYCKGNHAAYCRSCPNWIREKEILAVKKT